MKKKIFLLLVFLTFYKNTNAQDVNKQAYLLVLYDETSVSDSTDLLKKNYDVMGLEIGKSISRFYSISRAETQKTLTEQSKQTNSLDFSALKIPKNRRGKERIIYKNYDINQVSVFEKLGILNYTFQEPTPTIDWQIQTDTMRILNYPCQKAICQFRGRNYEAWFTSDINVSDGPWKFTGLPGLILKVVDSRGHFLFECKSIEKVDTEIVGINQKAQKISKEQFTSLNKQFMENPIPFMSDGRNGITFDTPPTNLPKRFYNPMELTEK